MEENKIAEATPIHISVAFKEPSGSTQTFIALTSVGALGIKIAKGEGGPVKPTVEEIQKALAEDEKNKPADQKDSAWFKLSAHFQALNADDKRSIAVRIREALYEFFKNGGWEDHPIDSNKYVWQEGPNSLNLTGLFDDDKGTVTKVPNGYYIAVSGAAVWGYELLG